MVYRFGSRMISNPRQQRCLYASTAYRNRSNMPFRIHYKLAIGVDNHTLSEQA
jgi:hypothetical protein